MAYTFDKSIESNRWLVEIDSSANYGYFENNRNGNGGGLWFDDNKCLIDYDGVFELSKEVIASIELLGFNADYAKDDES